MYAVFFSNWRSKLSSFFSASLILLFTARTAATSSTRSSNNLCFSSACCAAKYSSHAALSCLVPSSSWMRSSSSAFAEARVTRLKPMVSLLSAKYSCLACRLRVSSTSLSSSFCSHRHWRMSDSWFFATLCCTSLSSRCNRHFSLDCIACIALIAFFVSIRARWSSVTSITGVDLLAVKPRGPMGTAFTAVADRGWELLGDNTLCVF
mmetsp:Transcript_9921/g.23638  ORF Transcript_9921/g.23638 Transcript_9921/m.23638 type:complete len:207 (-) Transcript_9921:640-1260(-)